ncbi:MAG: calcium-binding protein [Sulfitobacter sp.]
MPVDPTDPVTGTENGDTLSGANGSDTLFGLGGDDSLTGEMGDDSLVGGDGNDTLRGGHGDDTLIGGDGDDEIEGLYGNDVIDTGAGNDHVFGRDGDDLIYGREGDDHLIGSIGTDTVFGGAGNDTLAGSQGNDEIHGGDGNDLAFIGVLEGSDRIFMDAGNDIVDGNSAGSSFYADGGAGNDTLTSGVGDDTLLGGAGNDLLNGGSGNDTLSGGGDSDTVSGGDGDDVFIVQDVPGTLLITDFNANGAADLIDLSMLEGYDSASSVSEVMTFGPFQSTLTLNVTGGELVLTVLSETPLQAADLGLAGVLEGTETGEGPTQLGEDTGPDGAGEDNDQDSDPDTYVLEGPDAGYFLIDPDTGELSNIDWFSPSYDQVWDANGDRVYEVSILERDADGAEVDRDDLELVVTETGAHWRDAQSGELVGEETLDGGAGEDTLDGGTEDDPDEGSDTGGGEDTNNNGGITYSISGADAAIFVVDPDTGDVDYQSWFTPSYDEVWDMDRDHIYEVSVLGTDTNGDEVSRSDLQLVVSETDATWRDAVEDEDTDDPALGENTIIGDAGDDSIAGEDAQGVIYSIAGPDAGVFEVDPDTGDLTNQSWFTPSYDEVWDMDRDHIYEVSVIGQDADGNDVSQSDHELVVTQTGAEWRAAILDQDLPEDEADPTQDDSPSENIVAGENAPGVSYAAAGEDASISEVDPDTGDLSYQSWFNPSYDEVWDMDRDHVYEVSVLGTDVDGNEVSHSAHELVVTETGAQWRLVNADPQTASDTEEALPEGVDMSETQMTSSAEFASAQDLMAALTLQNTEETMDLPIEPAEEDAMEDILL